MGNIMTRQKHYQQISMSIIVLAVMSFAVDYILPARAEKSDVMSQQYSIYSFSVHGATCIACLIEVDKLLRNMKGVKAVNINQTRRPLQVVVVFDKSQVQPIAFTKILQVHKYQVADEKSIPYNRRTMAEFFLSSQEKADENKPNLILP